MSIQNQFKPIPELNLPFLNQWRDKIIETAHSLKIDVPDRRELIDFEALFNEIKIKSLEKRERFEEANRKLDHRIEVYSRANYPDLVKKVKELKQYINRNIKELF